MNNYNKGSVLATQTKDAGRVAFYRNTYANLALGVLAFVVVEAILLRIDPLVKLLVPLSRFGWLALLTGFMFATMYARRIANRNSSKTMQYAGYLLFIVAEAIIFVPLLYAGLRYGAGTHLISQAAIVTAGLFTGLTVAVFLTKTDFSVLRTGLSVGFFIALGLIVAALLFGFTLGLWFSVAMVVLSAGSILYHTYQIKNRFSNDRYVPAALSLFASLMLMFWYIIRIMRRIR